MTDGAAVRVFLIGCLVVGLGVSTRGHEDPGISLPAGAVSGRGGEFVGHTQELSIIVPRLLRTDLLPRDLNSGWGNQFGIVCGQDRPFGGFLFIRRPGLFPRLRGFHCFTGRHIPDIFGVSRNNEKETYIH